MGLIRQTQGRPKPFIGRCWLLIPIVPGKPLGQWCHVCLVSSYIYHFTWVNGKLPLALSFTSSDQLGKASAEHKYRRLRKTQSANVRQYNPTWSAIRMDGILEGFSNTVTGVCVVTAIMGGNLPVTSPSLWCIYAYKLSWVDCVLSTWCRWFVQVKKV